MYLYLDEKLFCILIQIIQNSKIKLNAIQLAFIIILI